jgi:hypothetical protein
VCRVAGKDRNRDRRYFPDPLLQQHKHFVIGIGRACHGNTNAVELFSVIAALVAHHDFLVMRRQPVGADEMATGIDTRLSRCLPGCSRRNWRERLQDR